MYVIKVLSILLVTTNALANIEEGRNLEDSKSQDIEAIYPTEEISEDNEIKRAKKSATTTFCVEIRPTGPFQRPFQVCEPSEPAKPQEPTSVQTYSAYFAAPNYVPQDQPKPDVYKPPSQPKANAIYSAPIKTYSPPTPTPKQYVGHSASYGSYRSKSEDSGTEEHTGHLMRMSHADEINSDSAIVSEQQMRSTSHGASNYDSRSYGAASYVPVVPQHAEKHRSHNGLVITCQPNLAGYAHNVPSSLHHPPALHSYSYRSSMPSEYNNRYGRYQVQSQSYGNYQQPPTYKPAENAYKSSSAGQQSAVRPSTHQYSSVYSSQTAYVPSSSAYSSPHLLPPTSYAPQSNAINPSAPTSVPQALHPHHFVPQLQPARSYVHFSQNYAPVPSTPGNVHNSAYGPAIVPNSAPYAPASGYAPVPPPSVPSSYSQTQSYSNLPSNNVPSTSTSQGQGYISPGAYRETEEERRMQTVAQQHKEKHTIKKMEEMAHQRVTGSQWSSDMSKEKNTNDKKEEHVESSQKGWSAKKRATEEAVDVKAGSDKIDKNHETENDINRIDN